MSKKKLGTAIIITVIVVPLILMFVFKPSFTAKGAVEKHFEYDDTLHYINQIEAGAFEAWVYEDRQEELYKTFLVKKEGFFYESNHSTYVEKKDDSARKPSQ
ncbi:hypothetical protein [Halobacillus andaensis]|uniref:hypothetical protein n=1 Tax=Halobacillus andaensis TaxID=1176239 RepID=UPI003D710300